MPGTAENPNVAKDWMESVMTPGEVGEDKRRAKRFTMRLPIQVSFGSGILHELTGVTRDVGAGGVYFYLDTPLSTGTDIEYVVTLPRELVLMDRVQVRYRGRVVRTEAVPGEQIGIAAASTYFEYV